MSDISKKTSSLHSDPEDSEMLEEYVIDYKKVRPNRFAAHLKPGGRLIVLEPDVAQAFITNESVNAILRAILHALPQTS